MNEPKSDGFYWVRHSWLDVERKQRSADVVVEVWLFEPDNCLKVNVPGWHETFRVDDERFSEWSGPLVRMRVRVVDLEAKLRVLEERRSQDQAWENAFREELDRVSLLVGMPGSPNLATDVAPALEALLAKLQSPAHALATTERLLTSAFGPCDVYLRDRVTIRPWPAAFREVRAASLAEGFETLRDSEVHHG